MAGSGKTVAALKSVERKRSADRSRWTRIAVECNSIIGRKRRSDRAPAALADGAADNKTVAVTIGSDSSENYNECESIIIPSTTTEQSSTMEASGARPPPTTTFTMPSIAVTSTAETSTGSLGRSGGKRSAKIDFVRFDSVETIFTHTDHDEIMQRATIKDEIKR